MPEVVNLLFELIHVPDKKFTVMGIVDKCLLSELMKTVMKMFYVFFLIWVDFAVHGINRGNYFLDFLNIPDYLMLHMHVIFQSFSVRIDNGIFLFFKNVKIMMKFFTLGFKHLPQAVKKLYPLLNTFGIFTITNLKFLRSRKIILQCLLHAHYHYYQWQYFGKFHSMRYEFQTSYPEP